MRTLFVDFDGTICCDQFWRTLPVEQFKLVQHTLFASDPVAVNDWMRANFTSEEINRLVATKTGIEYSRLWAVFVRDCETMNISKGVLDAIDSLRGRFRVVLITDNMDCFDRFTVPALGLSDYFDDIANSSRENCLKTERNGETFIKYLIGDLKDAMLIDDSEEICAFFQNLGGTACLVTNVKPVELHLRALAAF